MRRFRDTQSCFDPGFWLESGHPGSHSKSQIRPYTDLRSTRTSIRKVATLCLYHKGNEKHAKDWNDGKQGEEVHRLLQ